MPTANHTPGQAYQRPPEFDPAFVGMTTRGKPRELSPNKIKAGCLTSGCKEKVALQLFLD
jgi:hypothetical protein